MQNKNDDSFEEIEKQPEINNADTVSDNENMNEEVIDTETEETYQKAINFMNSIKCMTPCKDKVKMYKDAAKKFLDLSGYKESETYAKKCKKKAKKTKEEIIKELYDKALQTKENAKSSGEYISAAENFRKAKDYLDAEEMAQQCDQLKSSLEKKEARKSFIRYGVMILCAAAIVFGFTAPCVKYFIAGIEKTVGIYNPAVKLYDKLGTYRDSEEKLVESRYLYGLHLETKGDYKSAAKMFAAAGDYKDSEVKNANDEKQVIKSSKVGTTVKVGINNWTIIDKQHNQALLMKKSAIKGKSYHDRLENVTWENSAVRKYLNSEFLKSTFSEKERDNIILTTVKNEDNNVYGTDGGNDTQDYVFLLSIAEASKYSKAFPKFKTNAWLRSPGNGQDSAAFLSASGAVMDYGYAVNSEEFSVRPVFWFKFK